MFVFDGLAHHVILSAIVADDEHCEKTRRVFCASPLFPSALFVHDAEKMLSSVA